MKLYLFIIACVALTTRLEARVDMNFDEEGSKGAPISVAYEEKSSLQKKTTQPSELVESGSAPAVEREDHETTGALTTDKEVEPMSSLTNDKIAGTGGGVAHLDPALLKDLNPLASTTWWGQIWNWIKSFFTLCP